MPQMFILELKPLAPKTSLSNALNYASAELVRASPVTLPRWHRYSAFLQRVVRFVVGDDQHFRGDTVRHWGSSTILILRATPPWLSSSLASAVSPSSALCSGSARCPPSRLTHAWHSVSLFHAPRSARRVAPHACSWEACDARAFVATFSSTTATVCCALPPDVLPSCTCNLIPSSPPSLSIFCGEQAVVDHCKVGFAKNPHIACPEEGAGLIPPDGILCIFRFHSNFGIHAKLSSPTGY
ncbi:hypothetical protein FB451DRAFT_1395577 [Mycena latifolia]|nr:hypothetical protein FB451DRAFT_1395577 [Mycena latifolia]